MGLKIVVPAKTLQFDKKQLRKVLRTAGSEVAALARSLIRKSSGGGRIGYKPGGGRYSASLPGQPPSSRTGATAGGIRVRTTLKGLGVRVVDATFYSRFLETGAQGGGGKKGTRNTRKRRAGKSILIAVVGRRVLQPRPFLTTAMDTKGESITARVRDAVVQGIEFKREK